MVSTSSIIAMAATLCVTLVLPLVIYIVYGVRNRGAGVWSAWGIGALGFVVLQLVIRLPILNLLSIQPWFASFAANRYVLYIFLLALTAALFEVVGRCLAAKLISRKGLTLKKGIAAGLGHGGIESIMIVGLTYINNLLYSLMINTGAFDVMVEAAAATGADVSALTAAQSALVSTSPLLFCLAGYERILTMVVHLALSLLVCYGFYKNRPWRSIGIAFFFHWALDFFVPLLNSLATPAMGNVLGTGTAYILVYGLMSLLAVLAVVMIRKISTNWKKEMQEG